MLVHEIVVALLLMLPAKANTPLYKDATKTPEERTEDLISRMTLQEKVAQLRCIWMGRFALHDAEGRLDMQKFEEAFHDGIGQWGRMSEDKTSIQNFYHSFSTDETVELYNRMQKYFVENTRLGIPIMVHEEGLHGHQSFHSTHFPIPLGLACSWDEALFGEIYTQVAKEIRAKGGHQVLAPVVDVTRDPRWGRTEETMGEDPYLNGRLGVAQVKAYQGTTGPNGEIDSDHVGATLKHFGIHGQSEGGSNTGPSFIDELYAHETFFRPFKMCIDEAGPYNVMISYNDIWGRPAHQNAHLVQDILRGEFGFKGLIVSDYGGVDNALEFNLTDSPKEAAYMSFMTGVEVELPEGANYTHLVELVQEGRISMEQIDSAVRDILLEKFRLGLFDNPYLDLDKSVATVGNDYARSLAYKAASESLVLLQNNDGVLPLDENKIETLAVIGPNAAEVHLGGYSNTPAVNVSVLDAVKERYADKMEVLYAEGCKITVSPSSADIIPSFIPDEVRDKSYEAPDEINAPLIEEAVKVASKADAVILCLGSNESVAREGTGKMLPGDTPTLELLGGQNDLVEAISKLGKPVVALIITGTPNNIAKVSDLASSVLMCYYPGQEGSYAMADAVFGKINPSGKLTLSIPRGAGYVPCYYSYKPQARRGYTLGNSNTALYPFGYGLSYTSYEYSNLRLSSSSMSEGDTVVATVDVTNTGKVAGDEIVQLYIHDDLASVTRPVMELKGFKRVHIEPGQTVPVSIPVDRSSLEFYNMDMDLVVEKGTFTVLVGPSSDKLQSVPLTLR